MIIFTIIGVIVLLILLWPVTRATVWLLRVIWWDRKHAVTLLGWLEVWLDGFEGGIVCYSNRTSSLYFDLSEES